MHSDIQTDVLALAGLICPFVIAAQRERAKLSQQDALRYGTDIVQGLMQDPNSQALFLLMTEHPGPIELTWTEDSYARYEAARHLLIEIGADLPARGADLADQHTTIPLFQDDLAKALATRFAQYSHLEWKELKDALAHAVGTYIAHFRTGN